MSKRKANSYEQFDQRDGAICEQKRRYNTKTQARDVAAKQGIGLSPYKCAICRKFHLTHYDATEAASVRATIRARAKK